ncbi:MAG: SDR family NAD(P)-dependent oxidoreductase [Myxococcota bacterium]
MYPSTKVYLVLGASSGIGRAAAQRLAKDGHAVVLGARRLPLCQDLAEELRSHGARADAVRVDLDVESELCEAVRFAQARFGGLSGAVNAAGILTPLGPIEAVDAEAAAQLLRTNVLGTLLAMKHQIPALAEGGAIVNVASIVGRKTFPGTAPYTASKLAMVGLTRVAAAEGAERGIRVNLVSPGPVVTAMAREAFGDEASIHAAAASTPARRAGQPEDIADIIGFLLSEEARHINGEEIVADGGYIL